MNLLQYTHIRLVQKTLAFPLKLLTLHQINIKNLTRLFIVIMLGLTAFGCSSSKGGITPEDALSKPVLEDVNLTSMVIGNPITPIEFVNSGGGQLISCKAENSLPVGIILSVSQNTNTCVLSGVPSEASAESLYTITGTNSRGSDTSTISIIAVEPEPNAFITAWKTDNPGSSSDKQITIGATGGGYDFNIDWGDGSKDVNVINSIQHTYDKAGTYTVTINGDYPLIDFSLDPEKLLSVEQWGAIKWRSMSSAFKDCKNLVINAQDVPDLSEVRDMSHMFSHAESFNNDISAWDVSLVTNMRNMFYSASSFNQDLSTWDVSSVTNMRWMFIDAKVFDQDLSSWDVSSVTTMWGMFYLASSFNQDLSTWDVSSVTNMRDMFNQNERFNQDISTWDVSSVTQMGGMFHYAKAFNQDLSAWDVSSVEYMGGMFSSASEFNQDLSSWDVSSVRSMDFMFLNTEAFNQDLSAWDVSSVISMRYMFGSSQSFDQDLSLWDVSSVTDMKSMFSGAAMFNQDLSTWDVSSVTNMDEMFSAAKQFNQNLSTWDVSSVTDMHWMFLGASLFNQDLSTWDVSSVNDMSDMLYKSGISTENYDLLLLGWSALNLQKEVKFGIGNVQYSPISQGSRDILSNTFKWSISDGGVNTP